MSDRKLALSFDTLYPWEVRYNTVLYVCSVYPSASVFLVLGSSFFPDLGQEAALRRKKRSSGAAHASYSRPQRSLPPREGSTPRPGSEKTGFARALPFLQHPLFAPRAFHQRGRTRAANSSRVPVMARRLLPPNPRQKLRRAYSCHFQYPIYSIYLFTKTHAF